MRFLTTLKTSSLFKIAIAITLVLLTRNGYIACLFSFYLVLDDFNSLLIYIILLVLIIACEAINKPFNYAYISKIEDNKMILNTPFYQIRTKRQSSLEYGDYICFEGDFHSTTKQNDLAKNVRYEVEIKNYQLIKRNKNVKNLIYRYIDKTYGEDAKALLHKFLYGNNDYDKLDDFFLLSGFAFIYFLRYIDSKIKNSTILYIYIYIYIYITYIKYCLFWP